MSPRERSTPDPGAGARSNGRERAFRLLPAVDEVLRSPEAAALADEVGSDLVRSWVRESLDGWRRAVGAGELSAADVERRLAEGELGRELVARRRLEEGRGLRRAVNATGVVLHTGLGRAPVHPDAARAMAEAAAGYCVLEVDRFTGERNRRDDRLSELVRRATGAEAAICVNNNAAAVLLCLQTFAGGGRAAVVSRGELVEIGGSFRMPEVMERAGARLCEVGTTNRTRRADFTAAIDADTGLLIKVHTSNFRVEGFTEEVGAAELAALGREHGVPTVYDVGSGWLEPEGAAVPAALAGEPGVRAAVASGVDVVTFSGDKLIGGPQAGILAGRRGAIERLRANPTYRALRLDKVAIAGLEATLELHLAGRASELPTHAMLLAPEAELAARARDLAARLAAVEGLRAEVGADESQPGSGSAPGVGLATSVVRVSHARLSARALVQALREHEPPVFARVRDDRVVLDPRTLLAGDDAVVERALRAAV